jgi:hypothetical protein
VQLVVRQSCEQPRLRRQAGVTKGATHAERLFPKVGKFGEKNGVLNGWRHVPQAGSTAARNAKKELHCTVSAPPEQAAWMLARDDAEQLLVFCGSTACVTAAGQVP